MNKDKQEKNQPSGADQFAFTRLNYIMLATGFIVIIIGMFLMAGGGSDDPNVFSEEIFSFRRLSLAPITIIAGYLIVLYSIMKKTGE